MSEVVEYTTGRKAGDGSYRSFGYDYGQVVCILDNGQFVLEPIDGSIEKALTLFSGLPDSLNLWAGDHKLTIGGLRTSIRDAEKQNRNFPVLAIRTQIKPGPYYRLYPDEEELAVAWMDEIARYAKVEWTTKPKIRYAMNVMFPRSHSYELRVLGRGKQGLEEEKSIKFSATVELHPREYKLKVIYTNLFSGKSLVWSPSMKSLFFGTPAREHLPGLD